LQVVRDLKPVPHTQPAQSARSEEKLNRQLTEYAIRKPARIESGKVTRNVDLGEPSYAFASNYGKDRF
jgi:hypothetical protein